jgi:hypothetical protein
VIFSLPKRCYLQLDNLDKLTIVIKNCPNDLGMGYSSPFTLIELIGGDVTLEEELNNMKVNLSKMNFNLDL